MQKNGVSKVNQDLSVCFGEKESGGTSCFNDDKIIGLRNLVTERDVTEELAFYWAVNVRRIFYGVPKSKPRLCLFAFGRAEVRVAFNDRAERYHSRNLVTERSVIGQYDLIVERERYHSCNLVTERED